MTENLWAPWRMEFIDDQRQKKGGAPCIFCELSQAKPDDKNLILTKGKTVYIVMNRFPYTNGHLLIVPYKHLAHLKEFPPATHQEILALTTRSMDILSECIKAEGFNCGMNVGRVAGCGILDHYHWHVVPRWNGDTNFLPVLTGGVRAMPEYLGQTYHRLIKEFERGNS